MKKNILLQGVTNLLLLCILSVLALFCIPLQTEQTFAPIYKGSSVNNRVGLLFNVYQGSEYVEQILSVLDTYDVPCTFFVGGVWAEKNIPLLQKMALSAEIGNHGYLHRDHSALSFAQNREEVMLCHALVKKATGMEMTLFAPPSGSFSSVTLDVCEQNGYQVILWSKDTVDWRDQDAALIVKRATTDVQSGDLILMHPTAATVSALPSVLTILLQKNLLPSTVTDVLRADV